MLNPPGPGQEAIQACEAGIGDVVQHHYGPFAVVQAVQIIDAAIVR